MKGGSPQLVAVKQGETVSTEDIRSSRCRPGRRRALQRSHAFASAAMEGAGKMVDDEELRAAMAERGLGTRFSRARAQIIEGLISEQYIHRDGRELIPSAKAFARSRCSRARASPADFAGTDRRLGIQARADEHGPPSRSLHERDRRDDA